MDWLFDNLGKIITALITIVYVLGSLRGSAKEDEAEEQDPEAQARARRIQEEIRRKILERQRGSAPQTELAEEPEPYGEGPFADLYPPARPVQEVEERRPEPWRPAQPQQPQPAARPVYQRAPEDLEDPDSDPFAEQRRKIEEQLAKARSLKERARGARRDASMANYKRAYRGEAASPSLLRSTIRRDLSDTASLRAALVLKEILDKPLALR